MKVQDAMTHDVTVCSENDSLNRAAHLMWTGDCGCIPVINNLGIVCGVITDRDICMAAYTQGRPLHEIHVRDAMSSVAHACRPSDSVETALALMKHNKVRRIPVTEDGRAVGMLSLSDLLTVLHSSQQGRRTEEPYTAALLETLVVVTARRDANGNGTRDRALPGSDASRANAVARGN